MIIYILCGIVTLIWIQQFFFKKNYFSVITYVWAGIYIPLLLYQIGWSRLIDKTNSNMFNYIFVCFTIILAVYWWNTKNTKPSTIEANEKIKITKTGKQLAPIINIVFVLLYLIENYLGSGMLFPGLRRVDIHTYSAPFISYITNSQFLVMAFDYYAYKASKKKKYWLFIVIVFAIPIVSRSSRMQMMISAVQFACLLIFMEMPGAIKSLKAKKNYKKIKRIIIVLGIAIIIGTVGFTNYRMNHYGVYNFSYAEAIGYNGPEWLSFLAPYYGYFPLSFNNLKINIINRAVTHNYIGLYSFAALYFGIFQLDNLLNINTLGSLQNRLVTNAAATVPTGFWEYYYDFDFLCFIPMLVAFFICYHFLKKSKNERRKLTFRTLYFWYAPLWFFMSFQNVMFGTTIIVVGVIIYYIITKSFVIVSSTL